MKKKNLILILIAALFLVAAALVTVSLISADKNELKLTSTDLMDGVQREKVKVMENIGTYGTEVTDFSLRLFQNSMVPGENSLISPLSVLGALGMTANGADGATLEGMEAALGMTTEEINEFLYGFMDMAVERETNQLHLANAIWLKDDDKLIVRDDFLKTNAAHYDAGVYKAPFDETTRDDINAWVNHKTNNMIPEILSEIPEEAVLYLVNALSFDAKWETIYYEAQVHERIFTTEEGREQSMELMYGSEGRYLEDEKATGFMKYYKDRQYAFAALLPNEGITVADYVAGLTGAGLYDMLSKPQEAYVVTGLPKFQITSDYELQDALREMGMTTAFDVASANFSRLGTHENGNLFISRILHKTFISVTEEGTRAAAATAVELPAGAPADMKEVYLDRPFLYMIIDCETTTPIFIGTVMTME